MSNELSGLLLVNKPSGCTSHDVVDRVRKILKTKSVGHTGTLDPLASGLMVLLVGQATKLSDFFLKGNKGYRVKIRLGISTDSYDSTGRIMSEKSVDGISEEKIREKISALLGHQVLGIPAFSAKKINGEKLCDMARRGERVPDVEKDMFFYDLNIFRVESPIVELSFSCSKGSFVRSWVHKLGELLQVGACVEELERIYSEPYKLSDAICLDTLNVEELGPAWVPFENVLPDWPGITVTEQEQVIIQNGQLPSLLKSRIQRLAEKEEYPLGIRVLTAKNQLLSVVERTGDIKPHDFKIRRVFPQT